MSDLLQANIRGMWAAFRDKKREAYADYLWDDYEAVEEDSQGERNKLRVLREVDESVVVDYTLQLFQVDPIGADAALVTYENVIKFPPKSRTRFEKIFVSEIWVQRHGQWKAWRYQATRVR
ncbi:MAG: nuclear transport factor 2 family protein [Candidatus Acidiferrales bacterium]